MMNDKIIARAGELIASKTDFIGGGMEGNCVLSLIDENGYPSASTVTVSKADGINWLTFLDGDGSSKTNRIAKCSKACVCFSSSEYNVSLVGTIEILTDEDSKRENWQEPMCEYFSGAADENYWVLRFNTERYSIFFADDDSEARGSLKDSETRAPLKVTPGLGFKGECSQAIALYEKAFGAVVVEKLLYSDANPGDLQYKEEEKDFVFYAEIVIGDRLISLGDDSEGKLDASIKGKASAVSLLIEFESMDELNAAYEIISDGATIVTPLCDSSYCAAYASLVDKFGIHWDLMSGYVG